MVVVPRPIPTICTVVVFEFAGIVTVAGTVAIAMLSETSAILSEVGVFAERFSAIVCEVPLAMEGLGGAKLSDAVTLTDPAPEAYPGADAVIVAVPTLTPVTCGWVAGVVAPAP